jgi:O-Antigen ligase
MANTTINIPRAHLIMALCLPLAVLVGYFLAEPLESGSMAVIVLVMFVLAVPLLMKWYHPLLLLSWNTAIVPAFLPGTPPFWMLIAVASLLFAVLNRSVNPDNKFISMPAITKSILFLGAVVLVTCILNGGIGLRALGNARYGGKNYLLMLSAIGGYFVFSSQRIPVERAPLFVALFFLTALTGIVPNVVYRLGPAFYPLFNLFPASGAFEEARGDLSLAPTIARITGLAYVAAALYNFLLARYGVRGTLDLRKPWRIGLLLLAVVCCIGCGFRSALMLLVFTFASAFIFEGLHRTRLLPILISIVLLAAAIVLPQSEKLPLPVQRTISFLPIKTDPLVAKSASDTTTWRIEMWKEAVRQIPQYFFKGKGYSLNPNEWTLITGITRNPVESPYEAMLATGDYHNGPLSVILPFGIFGVIGFVWFLTASVRFLLHNYRFGDPRLHTINSFLLAAFVARIVFFIVIFGSLYSDLFTFTGLVGLSLSLNGSPEPVTEPAMEAELSEAFS